MTYRVFAVSDSEYHITRDDPPPHMRTFMVVSFTGDMPDLVPEDFAGAIAQLLNNGMNEEDLCDAIALFQERKNRFEDCPF